MGEMITIPAAEYRALLGSASNLADLTAHDRAMAAIARGDEELVPEAFAKRLIAGRKPGARLARTARPDPGGAFERVRRQPRADRQYRERREVRLGRDLAQAGGRAEGWVGRFGLMFC